MCILCVIQKWSRRIATMLPWLVLPLIGLWALSQMLPPAFRFEITSPRLACVFVLLVTLFWYEILMPKLSAWRAHRNARLRERKRNEAIELQKLRKTATRKCRNCLTPYRDQNPCGGKFMCSYCGHISKRPVLDLPVPPGISNSGIIKELVGKGGKLLNGRLWSENGWMCSQDWRDNGNWGGGTFAAKPVNWRKNGNGLFGGDEHCLAEKSYSGVVIFTCKLLTSFFLSIRWLWRKIFSGSSSSEDVSFNNEHSGILSKRGECFHESRSEKARRKAEERRQARLERELLEEEERKQREEVARLVEERRKLRDEKIEAEKDGEKVLSPTKEKDIKREAEKKRHERRRDRDKGSSKSNSDAEELEKRAGKETDRRSDNDGREIQKSAMDMMVKGQTNDIGRGPKNVTAHNVNRGSAGARYLDRMRNNIISSSKAFSGTSFFGRAANTPVAVAKESKPGTVVNHVHPSAHRREIGPPERVAGKSVLNGVPLEPQPLPAPKKSWQQLFTRSTPVHPSSTTNLISRPNNVVPNEVKSPMLPGQTLSAPFNDKQINFGLPSPFPVYTLPNAATSSSLGFTSAIDPIFPHVGGRQRDNIPEEPELFEDPCYVPDPVSLLGPVSESLDNFQLDLGSGFISEIGLEKQRASRIAGPAPEISRPSPIESPMSRLRGVDDRHNNANRLPGTPKSQDKRNSQVEDGSDEKTWQLWGPSPLGQDGLGLIGGPVWHLNPDRNRSSKEELTRPSSQRTMASLFAKEDPVLTKTYSPQKDLLSGGQNGVNFSPAAVSNDKDPWVQKAFIPPLSDNEKHFAFKLQEDSTQSEVLYGSPTRTASTHPFVLSPADCWSKQEWAATESGEHSGSPSLATPHIGDAYPPQIYSHFGTLKGK